MTDKTQLGKLGNDLAVATACRDFFKAACEDIRARVINEFETAYENTGVDRLSLKVGDVETAKATYVKPESRIYVYDSAAFERWLIENGKAVVTSRINVEALPTRVINVLMEDYPEAVITDVVPETGWDAGIGRSAGNDVITADGEYVPGVRWADGNPTIRVTKAKEWKDDAKTIRLALEVGAVAGLLGGGE